MDAPPQERSSTKQEQLPASDEVTELAPRVLRTQLPIDFTGLGHVNMYVLLDDDGAAVVDPGMPFPGSYHMVMDRLARCGLRVADVHTVVVTHSHPDHYGGAGKLAEDSGATVLTERTFHVPGLPEEPDLLDGAELEDLRFTSAGIEVPWRAPGDTIAPPADALPPTSDGRPARPHHVLPSPRPDRRVDDAEMIRLAGRSWRAMHTPGHTGDHLCLHDAEFGLLLSGDHVLPSITPHISAMRVTGDALESYFRSLAMVAALPPETLVLPAHGHPFIGIAERVDAIRAHHTERLDQLVEITAGLGPAPVPVPELSRQLFSKRHWGLMAESETYAHLEHLCFTRRLRRVRRHDAPHYAVVPA